MHVLRSFSEEEKFFVALAEKKDGQRELASVGSTKCSTSPRSVYWFCIRFVSRRTKYGGCSSAGRAPDCDSGCRGFDPRQPPHFLSHSTIIFGHFYFSCASTNLRHLYRKSKLLTFRSFVSSLGGHW